MYKGFDELVKVLDKIREEMENKELAKEQCECTKKQGRSAEWPQQWTSQRRTTGDPMDQLYQGNVAVVAAAFTTGLKMKKLHDTAKTMGLAIPSRQTANMYRRRFIEPVVDRIYTDKMKGTMCKVLQANDEQKRVTNGQVSRISLCGDGQHDSIGHSASIMRYFMMDALTSCIVHFEVCHVKDAATGFHSQNMEKVGFDRAMSHMIKQGEADGYEVETFISDKHGSILKAMREKYPGIRHCLDKWHAAKNLRANMFKELERVHKESASNGRDRRDWAAIKKASTNTLAACVDRILNHFWYAVEKANGMGDLLMELMMSMLLHCSGKHTDFHGNQELTEGVWFEFKQMDKCYHDHAHGQENTEEESGDEGKEQDGDEMTHEHDDENDEEGDEVDNFRSCSSPPLLHGRSQNFPRSNSPAEPRQRAVLDSQFEPHSMVIQAIYNALLKQQKTIAMCAPVYTTSAIELANSLSSNAYLSKATWYTPMMYILKTKLVILDWNEKALHNMETEKGKEENDNEEDDEGPPPLKKIRVWSKARKRFVYKTRRAVPEHKFRREIVDGVMQLIAQRAPRNKAGPESETPRSASVRAPMRRLLVDDPMGE